MRLDAIAETKSVLSGEIQALPAGDISDRIVDQFRLTPREARKRQALRFVARPVLTLQQPYIRGRLGFDLSFPCDAMSFGERFANDSARAALHQMIGDQEVQRVLIPGCYLGSEDVQYWLRRGARYLDGVDIYSLEQRWQRIVPELNRHYQSEVAFRQASIEQLPFPDGTFDLIASAEVLEHVRNLRSTVQETARVLRPGGWAWHSFGPLYYTFGGDHCIASYGEASGYDHLTLDELTYQERIRNQAMFDAMADPNAPFWALQQQFSFAAAAEYLALFAARFRIRYVLAKISPEGLAFRKHWPSLWQRMLDAGVAEEDLLVKSLIVILQLQQ